MANLNAEKSVQLGPYRQGRTLNVTSPKTDSVQQFPTLSYKGKNVVLGLKFVPKIVTLAKENEYTLTAGSEGITYSVD